MTDIQVLTPGRKGELGTGELNRRLQEALNPPEKGKKKSPFMECCSAKATKSCR